MESQDKQQSQPKDEKKINADAMFYELNRTLNRAFWVTRIAVFYFKFLRKAVKVTENLFIASWFGLILIGIWSDDTIYYKIAFTVLVSGGVLAFIFKALDELFKKSKPAQPNPVVSDATKNMLIMSIVMDKFKNDEAYRNDVVKKFFDDMMAKKGSAKPEGEQEEKA